MHAQIVNENEIVNRNQTCVWLTDSNLWTEGYCKVCQKQALQMIYKKAIMKTSKAVDSARFSMRRFIISKKAQKHASWKTIRWQNNCTGSTARITRLILMNSYTSIAQIQWRTGDLPILAECYITNMDVSSIDSIPHYKTV